MGSEPSGSRQRKSAQSSLFLFHFILFKDLGAPLVFEVTVLMQN